jgi:hypothetical protein
MLSLMHCLMNSLPSADGPFSLIQARDISHLACGPSEIGQWFDIVAALPTDDAGLALLLDPVTKALRDYGQYDVRVAWLKCWYAHSLTTHPNLPEGCFHGESIPVFSWILDSPLPELKCYFGLILTILQSFRSSQPLSDSVFGSVCADETLRVYDKICQFLEDYWRNAPGMRLVSDITEQGVNLCKDALKIRDIIDGLIP